MQARMRRLTQPVEVSALPGERPLADRVLAPLGDFLRSRTPAERIRLSRERLLSAGRPLSLTVGRLLAVRALMGVVFTLAAAVLLPTGMQLAGLPALATSVVLAVAVGLVGYMLPDLWLRRLVHRRRDAIRRQLSDVCDLLSVCADAGAPFDVALRRVVESPYMKGPLIDELSMVLRQVQFATDRLEALQKMAQRLGLQELRVFVTAVGESFKRGTPIADVLRLESQEIRRRARDRAEARANQASIKMLFPLILLIFPTLFLIILTPAIIRATQSASGG
jgi:tight adherence protein C